MSLFQKSVEQKYLNELDSRFLDTKFTELKLYFGNPVIQENIRNSKEEQFQEGFFRELFVNILGYTLNPEPNYNLTTELKNISNSKKADGAILRDNYALAVIELKSTSTTDLDTVESQAFGYKNYNSKCAYVITSNFEKIRFYIQNAVENIEFELFNLSREQFSLLWLCLAKDNLLNDVPLKIKTGSVLKEENVTKELYNDYSNFRNALFENLVKDNPDKDRLLLFRKTQKLLDRFLFIFFAEDRQLLPPNSISEIVKQWRNLKEELDAYIPLYERFKKYFGYLNTGHKGKTFDIYPYDGGLFTPDTLLDNIKIDDNFLHEHTLKLSSYDFNSEVDVNILGHIFEHSLNEIENVQAEIKGEVLDRQKTRRKKEGIFYTPKYITKYIVDNTIGKLCKEKRNELEIIDDEYAKGRKNRKKKIVKNLDEKLTIYRNWLLSLKILDPACGSGAFLNQALEYLIEEHKKIDELKARLMGASIVFSDIETEILEHNIFGVDLNEESVEIAKLSLWLHTAQRGRKLTSLNNNIKCGNSLVDDPKVAGEKSFNWQNEFPLVFENGGFNVVIGNPPYGAYMDSKTKAYISSMYVSFQGNYEIYFFFIELANRLLKEKGKLGFITPDTWISIPQAKKLREQVLSLYGLNKIISYKYSVFEEASVNSIVFILTKGSKSTQCEVFHVNSKTLNGFYDIGNSQTCDVRNWERSIDKQFQIWQDAADIRIIEKIEKISEKGETFLDVCQGIVPYSTETLSIEQVKERIYHSKEMLGDDYGPWVQGRAIKRYVIDESNKEFLKYGGWLHRPRNSKYFNGNRILIQEITGGNPPRISATIYNKKLYHDPGIISCLNISSLSIKYLIGIINSKLISWYNLKTSPKAKRTTFPKVLIGDIRKFPIKIPQEKQEQFVIEMVDNIILLTSELQKVKTQFTAFLLGKFSIEKVSEKLQAWDDLEYNEFLDELKKAKIQLSLSEEVEWMKYFNDQNRKTEKLKTEIDKIDNGIDQLIYTIYGLADDEVKIVEGQ